MPAKSEKQQQAFGIARAIQKGEQPAKPGTPSAQIAKAKPSDVRKYAKTKHKGLPKKVKSESAEKLREYIRRSVQEVLTERRIMREDASSELMRGGMKTWWKHKPYDIMSFVYWTKRQLPPSDKSKLARAWKQLVPQLQKKHPAPEQDYKRMLASKEVSRPIDPKLPSYKDDQILAALTRAQEKGDKKEVEWFARAAKLRGLKTRN